MSNKWSEFYMNEPRFDVPIVCTVESNDSCKRVLAIHTSDGKYKDLLYNTEINKYHISFWKYVDDIAECRRLKYMFNSIVNTDNK